MSDGSKIVGTTLAIFALVALPAISRSPSDPEARCREVLAHRSTLGSRVTVGGEELASEVARCRESITQTQAACAIDALSLDEFERCFM